jgi:hypothetical protein
LKLIQKGYERLEPDVVKVASTVLRGLGAGNSLWLLGNLHIRFCEGAHSNLGVLPQQEVRYGLYSTNHMKQICMGLAVSEDNIPFMHEVYEGNKHDAKIFPELLDALTERLTNLKITTEEMVLVFDNNSIKLKNIPT